MNGAHFLAVEREEPSEAVFDKRHLENRTSAAQIDHCADAWLPVPVIFPLQHIQNLDWRSTQASAMAVPDAARADDSSDMYTA